MYKVKNIIHGKVLLADLDNLIIAHNSAVDLDSRFSRERIKNSANLKKALSEECKYLVLLEDSEKDLQESLKSLEDKIKQDILNEIASRQSQPVNDLTEINNKFDLLLNAIKNNTGQTIINNNIPSSSNKNVDFIDEEDDEKMINIHKKTIERLSKNSSANIQSTQSEIKDSGVTDNLDELEGLL